MCDTDNMKQVRASLNRGNITMSTVSGVEYSTNSQKTRESGALGRLDGAYAVDDCGRRAQGKYSLDTKSVCYVLPVFSAADPCRIHCQAVVVLIAKDMVANVLQAGVQLFSLEGNQLQLNMSRQSLQLEKRMTPWKD